MTRTCNKRIHDPRKDTSSAGYIVLFCFTFKKTGH